MVDYGGKMPELQEHLCALLSLTRKVLPCMNQSQYLLTFSDLNWFPQLYSHLSAGAFRSS